jgi:hypothetical protein
VNGYIALQLYLTHSSFLHIAKGDKDELKWLIKGMRRLARGLNRIKMPILIGAILNAIQYYNTYFVTPSSTIV